MLSHKLNKLPAQTFFGSSRTSVTYPCHARLSCAPITHFFGGKRGCVTSSKNVCVLIVCLAHLRSVPVIFRHHPACGCRGRHVRRATILVFQGERNLESVKSAHGDGDWRVVASLALRNQDGGQLNTAIDCRDNHTHTTPPPPLKKR